LAEEEEELCGGGEAFCGEGGELLGGFWLEGGG